MNRIEMPGNVFPRKLDRPLPAAAHDGGIWITDDNGRRNMDASGGAIPGKARNCQKKNAATG